MEGQQVRGLSGFGALSVGDALDALGDQRRRIVIRALAGLEEPVSVRELATRIVAMEDAPGDRDRIVVDLHHRTLPKLDALDLVEYDPDETLVEPCDTVTDLLGLVEHVEYTDSTQ